MNSTQFKVFILLSLVLPIPNVLWAQQQSETATLDELTETYDLDNPERNYKDLDSVKLELQERDPSDTRTEDTINRVFSDPGQEEFDDYSRYNSDVNESELRQKAASWASSDASTMGQPSQDANGNTKLSYSERGTRKLKRNANGDMVVESVDGGEVRNSGVSEEEVYSSELNNETHTQFDGVKNAYGDESALYSAGSQNLSTLKNEATKTGDGVAYRTILGSADKAMETNIDESILDLSREQLSKLKEDPSSFFSSCTTTTETKTVGAEGEIVDNTSCTDIDDSNYDYCEIERVVSTTTTGSDYYEGYECLKGEPIPDEEFPYGNYDPSGHWVVYPNMGAQHVEKYSCIKGQIHPDGNGGYDFVIPDSLGSGTMLNPRVFMPAQETREFWSAGELQGKVDSGELSIVKGSIYPHPDWDPMDWSTWHLEYSAESNQHWIYAPYELGIQSAASAGGLFATSGRVNERKTVRTQKLVQHPAGCLDDTGEDVIMKTGEIEYDEIGTATVNSNASPAMAPMAMMTRMSTASAASSSDSYCTFDGFTVIEEGERDYEQGLLDAFGPMFEGDSGNVTWKANLDSYRCDPFKGEKTCVTNYETGEVECFTWEELKDKFANRDQEKSCRLLENKSNCEVVEQTCLEGAMDDDGICRIYNREYECTSSIGGSSTAITETSTCESLVPCAGGDCDNTNNETNDDFNEAVGVASLLENINADNQCNAGDGVSSCEVFPGHFGTCDKPTSGSIADAIALAGPNCCEDPNRVGVATYVKAVYQARQFETVQNMETYAVEAAKGAYDKITTTDTYKTITKPITSAWESIGGNSSGATGGASAGAGKNFFEDGMNAMGEAMMDWMADNLPQDIAKSLFVHETSKNAAGDVVTTFGDPPEWSETMVDAGNFMQGVMTAYSYYTWIKMAIDIAFQCEEEETEVAGQIGQKACVYVGEGSCKVSIPLGGCERRTYNYCCFNSIFARIVMEQAAEQLGRPLGEGEACRGLNYSELQALDWGQIDLESEWIPLMYESGLLPEEMTEDALTGDGRTMNKGARANVSIRTLERLGDVDDEVIQKMKDEMREPLDCSQYPRPAECYYRNPPGN